jgi:nucleotide-binding universal stress UspA family protein
MPAKTIVAGTDGSEESLRAVEWAARETALREAALRIVSVPVTWPDAGSPGKFSHAISPQLVADVERKDAERALADAAGRAAADAVMRLDATLAPWRAKYPGVQTGWEVVHAHPARVLSGASARADLVVLGRHREGSAVGSITHAVLDHAHGAVAAVPGD